MKPDPHRLARTLDLGCGPKKTPGAVGVDRDPRTRPDLVHDLEQAPWPLPDDHFERVICRHILEHLPDIDAAFREIHRVACHGARIEIVTPHFSSVNSYDDPTHRHHFSSAAFDRYCTPVDGEAPGFHPVSKELGFGSAVLNVLPRSIARRHLRWYEKHLAFVLPARNLRIVLEVRKG